VTDQTPPPQSLWDVFQREIDRVHRAQTTTSKRVDTLWDTRTELVAVDGKGGRIKTMEDGMATMEQSAQKMSDSVAKLIENRTRDRVYLGILISTASFIAATLGVWVITSILGKT